MPEVRVGIVSWNTAELLDACLAALPAALGELDAQVVVVDNASTDASVAVARSHAGVEVVANDANRGYAAAMNQALAAGDPADVLIALNPDTVAPPGSLAALVARLRSSPRLGLVVPRLVHADGSLQHSCYRFPTVTVALVVGLVPRWLQRGPIGRRWWLEGAAPHDELAEVDWAIGAVHVLRTDALAGAPPYDDRWFMYAEDIDRCWRLHAAGWAVELVADVTVVHVGNASGEQAWGGARSARYWRATYDAVARARSPRYARALAAANVLGVARVSTAFALAARLGGRRAAERRHIAASVRASREVHLDVLRHGPPPPDGPPDPPF